MCSYLFSLAIPERHQNCYLLRFFPDWKVLISMFSCWTDFDFKKITVGEYMFANSGTTPGISFRLTFQRQWGFSCVARWSRASVLHPKGVGVTNQQGREDTKGSLLWIGRIAYAWNFSTDTKTISNFKHEHHTVRSNCVFPSDSLQPLRIFKGTPKRRQCSVRKK